MYPGTVHYSTGTDRYNRFKLTLLMRAAPSSSIKPGPGAGGIAMSDQSAPAFLQKLMDMLSAAEYSEYIAWQPSGHAFLIKDVQKLEEIVLQNYFKHSNLQSFIRQLNMYSFSKTCHDPNYREFANPMFMRGRRDLLSQIKRKAQSQVVQQGGGKDYELLASAELPDQSSAAAESDMFGLAFTPEGADSDSVDDLKHRVRQLETKTWILSERYNELVSKHDSLCNILQAVFHPTHPAQPTYSPASSSIGSDDGGSSSSSSSSGITCSAASSILVAKPRALSEGTLSEEDGLTRLSPHANSVLITRMISIDSAREDTSSNLISSNRAVSECAGALSGDNRHLLLEALSSSSSRALSFIPHSIGSSSLGLGTAGRGLLDLVDAATFSVAVPQIPAGAAAAAAAAGKPIFRQSTIDNSQSSSRKRSKTGVEGEQITRMNTY